MDVTLNQNGLENLLGGNDAPEVKEASVRGGAGESISTQAAAYWGTDGKNKRTKLIGMILHCKNMLPSEAQTACLYCSLDVQEIIGKAGRENEVTVKPDTDPWGTPVQMAGGMRMRRLDVIRNDEAAA